jgi:conjugative transfer signal peptidase TraF
MLHRAFPCLLILSLILALALVGKLRAASAWQPRSPRQAGLGFNDTKSFPAGIYWASAKHPEKGDLVTFRPPSLPVFDLARQRGYIDRGECRLKRIVAAVDDTVTIEAGGVTGNGRRLGNSLPRPAELAGRPMPVCRLQGYRVQADEILVMSDYSRISFDGRYFGPIPRSCLQSVLRPVWTW